MLTLSPPASLVDWSLMAVLRSEMKADPGLEEVRVVGDWGPQAFRELAMPHEVRLHLDEALLGRLWLEGACANLWLEGLRVAGGTPVPSSTALKFVAKSTGGSRNVTVSGASVDARGFVRGVSLERFRGPDGVERPSTWHTGVTVEDSEVWGSAGDVFAIYGARNVVVRRNRLHDPVISSTTVDHVDLVQVTDCVPAGDGVLEGYDWPVGLLLEENLLFFSTLPAVWGGPHQGVILGTGIIDGAVIRGNRIGANDVGGVCIPGTGLILAGPSTGRVRAYGNSITTAHGGTIIYRDAGLGVEAWANPFVGHG